MLSLFPPDVLDEIWDLIESVSEGFLTYSYISIKTAKVKCTDYSKKKKKMFLNKIKRKENIPNNVMNN